MSTLSPNNRGGEFLLADQLRNQLVEFVTAGPLKREFDQQCQTYFHEFENSDESDREGVLDWFLFEWFDDGGRGALDHFLENRVDLEPAEQDILGEWRDSLNSVFHVRSVSPSNLALKDLDSGYSFDVTLTKDKSHELFKKGENVVARLLPLGDHVILSGLQYIMPDKKSAVAWLELRNKIDELHSPEEIEKAIKESCTAFCQLFGSDELTVPPSNLSSTLRRFQEFLLREYRAESNGTTAAERYKANIGRDLEVAECVEPPDQFKGAADVTILCDEFDGIVVLPDYSRFRRVFSSDDPEKEVPEWKQLVWSYVKNPDIPIVAFERVAEKYPNRVEKVLRAVLGKSEFSIEHLYAVLLHYKQPVEGLDDLEDEEQLWDLFNGNATESKDAKSPEVPSKTPRTASKPARTHSSERKSSGPAAKTSAVRKAAQKKAKSTPSGAGVRATRETKAAARKSGVRRRS